MKQMRDISEEKQTVPTSQEVDAKKEVARASRLLEVRANPPAVPVRGQIHRIGIWSMNFKIRPSNCNS